MCSYDGAGNMLKVRVLRVISFTAPVAWKLHSTGRIKVIPHKNPYYLWIFKMSMTKKPQTFHLPILCSYCKIVYRFGAF